MTAGDALECCNPPFSSRLFLYIHRPPRAAGYCLQTLPIHFLFLDFTSSSAVPLNAPNPPLDAYPPTTHYNYKDAFSPGIDTSDPSFSLVHHLLTCLPPLAALAPKLLADWCCFLLPVFTNAVAVKRSSQLIRPFAFTLESEAASCILFSTFLNPLRQPVACESLPQSADYIQIQKLACTTSSHPLQTPA